MRILLFLWVVLPTGAGELPPKQNCLKTMPYGQVFNGLTSEKKIIFKKNDSGQGSIFFKQPTSYDATYEWSGGTALRLDKRFEVKNQNFTLDMGFDTAEGAVVPTRRSFKVVVGKSNRQKLKISIYEQESGQPLLEIDCRSIFEQKSGSKIYPLYHYDTYAYFNGCIQQLGFPSVDCPVVEELSKKSNRRQKGVPSGTSGDDVSATVEKKSAQGQ